MARHYIYLAIFAIIMSAAFAQQTSSTFDNYCYSNCIILANDTRCENLCLFDDAAFNSFCSDTCLEKSGNADLCTMGCKLLVNKRTSMKSCFDSCAVSDSDAICDSNCNITSTVKMIMTTVGLTVNGNLNENKLAVIERNIADMFPNFTVATALGREIIVKEGKMNFTDENGKKYIRLPIGLENNEKLDSLVDHLNNVTIINDAVHIPIRSSLGKTVSSIIVETNGIRGKDGIGEGEITNISIKSDYIKVEINDNITEESNGTLKQPEVSIDADLNTIPTNVSIDIKLSEVSAATFAKFSDLAKANGLDITSKILAVEVTKENIQNKKEIGKAKFHIKVDKNWLSSAGGIENVRIARQDGNQYEILRTYIVGETTDGMVILEGDSPNGLSLYAMVTVGVTSTTGDTGRVVVSPGSGNGINPILIGAILLIVVAAVYFFVLKKK